jgi:hypothetical protein
MQSVGEERRLVFLLGLATLLAACKADTPPLSDGDDGVGDECTPYADQLVAYTPVAGGSPEDGERALGAPDDQLVTIATDDVLTIGFVSLGGVEDNVDEGADIRLHGIAAGGTEVTVSMSVDGELWETAGTAGNVAETDDLDLDIADTASLSLVVYLQLVGVSGELALDAAESLQTGCTTSDR